MDISIDFLKPEQKDEAATVLGDAFITNPNSVAIWRRQGNSERRKQAAIFRLLKLERPFSKVLVAHQAGELVGVLNMAPWPKCQMSAADTAKLVPRMMLILRGEVLRGAMARAAKLQGVWGQHDPKEPHWHLGPVGISPRLQGQGIGTQLMNRFCEMVDSDGRAAYLETDRPENVPFYKRFDFRVVGEEHILGVHNWFMWRDAR
jgi:ribosomal protein S18 acetylase RimI-like enzyme